MKDPALDNENTLTPGEYGRVITPPAASFEVNDYASGTHYYEDSNGVVEHEVTNAEFELSIDPDPAPAPEIDPDKEYTLDEFLELAREQGTVLPLWAWRKLRAAGKDVTGIAYDPSKPKEPNPDPTVRYLNRDARRAAQKAARRG